MNNIIYEERELEGERLELADKQGNYYLGPDLTLRRCTLVLRVAARWLSIRPTRLIDCGVEVKQELKNFSWTCASLKGCRFKGRMTGNDFGPWRNNGKDWEFGSVEDCDFTEARLSNCRFHGCDMRTVRLPRWPCFTILDPIGRSRELNSVQWPRRFGRVSIKGAVQGAALHGGRDHVRAHRGGAVRGRPRRSSRPSSRSSTSSCIDEQAALAHSMG